jgi:chromosome segregation ATPase
MKLNFSVKIQHFDLNGIRVSDSDMPVPEFSYQIVSDVKHHRFTEINEICRVFGIEEVNKFPNKLKSIYQEQMLRLKSISQKMNKEVQLTKMWFDQLRNNMVPEDSSGLDKFKSLYQLLDEELQIVKKGLASDVPEDSESAKLSPKEVVTLVKRVKALESEVKVKEARIASLLVVEEELSKAKLEKLNYQSEVFLLRHKLKETEQAGSVLRTKTIQQTTFTETEFVPPFVDGQLSANASKAFQMLVAHLNKTLSELSVQKAKSLDFELENAQLKKSDDFFKLKLDEVEKLKVALDTQNGEVTKLNRTNEENAGVIDRLNFKLTQLKEVNEQLLEAKSAVSEKVDGLKRHVDYLEGLCEEFKLKNELLIQKYGYFGKGGGTVEERTGDDGGERASQSGGRVGGQQEERDRGGDVSAVEARLHLNQLDGLRQQNEVLMGQLTVANETIAKKDSRLGELEGLVRAAREREERGQRKVEEQNDEIGGLKGGLAAKENTIKELQLRNVRMMGEVDELKALVGELQRGNETVGGEEGEGGRGGEGLEGGKGRVQGGGKGRVQGGGKGGVEGLLRDKQEELEGLLRDKQEELEENKRELERMRGVVERVSEELRGAGEGLEERERVLREREKQVGVLKEELRAEREGGAKSRGEVEELRRSCGDLGDKVEGLQRATDQLMGTLESKAQENGLLVGEADGLKQRLASEAANRRELKGQVGELHGKCRELEKECADLKRGGEGRVQEMERAIERMRAEAEGQRGALERLQMEKEELERELEGQLEKARQRAVAVELQLTGLMVREGNLVGEGERLRRELEVVKAAGDSKERGVREELERVRKGLEGRLARLMDQNRQLELQVIAQREKARATSEEGGSRVGETTSKVVRVDTTTVTGPSQSAVNDSAQKTKQLQRAIDENKRLKSQLELFKRELRESERSLEEKSEQLRALLGCSEQGALEQLKEVSKRVVELSGRLAESERQREGLLRRGEWLELELERRGREIEGMSERVEAGGGLGGQGGEEVERLVKVNQQLSGEVDALRRKVEDLEAMMEEQGKKGASECRRLEREKELLEEVIRKGERTVAKLRGELGGSERESVSSFVRVERRVEGGVGDAEDQKGLQDAVRRAEERAEERATKRADERVKLMVLELETLRAEALGGVGGKHTEKTTMANEGKGSDDGRLALMNKLSQEVVSLKSQRDGMEVKLQAKEHEVKNLKVAVEEGGKRSDGLSGELRERNGQLGEAMKEVERLKEEMEKLGKRGGDSEGGSVGESARGEGVVGKGEGVVGKGKREGGMQGEGVELAKLRREARESEARLGNMSDAIKALGALNDKLRGENDKLVAERDAAQRAVEEWEGKVKGLKEAMKELEQKRQLSGERVKALEGQLRGEGGVGSQSRDGERESAEKNMGLELEVERLRGEVGGQKEVVEKLQKALEEVRGQREKDSGDGRKGVSDGREREQLAAELRESRDREKKASERVAVGVKEIGELKSQIGLLKEQLNLAKGETTQREKEVQRLEGVVASLEEQLEKKTVEGRRLLERLEGRERAEGGSVGVLDEGVGEVEEAKAEGERLREEVERLREAVERLRKRELALGEEGLKAKGGLELMEEEVRQLKESCSGLRKELEGEREKREGVVGELAGAKAELSTKEGEVEALELRVKQLEQLRGEREREVGVVEGRLREQEEMSSQLRRRLVEVEGRVESGEVLGGGASVQKQLTSARGGEEETTRLEKEVRKLQEELAWLKSERVGQLEEAVGKFQEQLKEELARNGKLSEQVNELQLRLKRTTDELEDTQRKKGELAVQLERELQKGVQLGEKVGHYQGEMKDLRDKVAELKHEVIDAKQMIGKGKQEGRTGSGGEDSGRLAGLMESCGRLRVENETKQRELEELGRKLDKKESKLGEANQKLGIRLRGCGNR